MNQAATIDQQAVTPGQSTPLPVRTGKARLTPVYATTDLASGLPAKVRAFAYGFPTHHPQRWLLLLAADRLESGETVVREALTPGRQTLVIRHYARQARAHPIGFLATVILAFLVTRAIKWVARMLGMGR